MATEQEVLTVFGVLESAFGPQRPEKLGVFQMKFADTDVSELAAACDRCIDECQFFPSIKDILDRIAGHASADQATKMAWINTLSAATAGPSEYDPISGSYPTGADLDDASFRAIGGIAGLSALRDISGDASKLSFAERDFCDRYNAVAAYAPETVAASDPRAPRQLTSGQPRQLTDGLAASMSRILGGQPNQVVIRMKPESDIAAPYEPAGCAILTPETLTHGDNAHPWEGVKNLLRRRLHPVEFQTWIAHLQFGGHDMRTKVYVIDVDPISMQTLDRNDGWLRNLICTAVCEWCGCDDMTVRWRVAA